MKTFNKKIARTSIGIVLATLISTVAMSAFAKGPELNQRVTQIPLKPSHNWPDFNVVTVANAYTSGPQGLLRHGSCKSYIKAVVKNIGAKYTYGQKMTTKGGKTVYGGQVIVRLEIYKNGVFKAGHNHFMNSWNANEVKEPKAGFYFTQPGTYLLKTYVRSCAKGSSTTKCPQFPERRTNNNSSSVSTTVSQAC